MFYFMNDYECLLLTNCLGVLILDLTLHNIYKSE